MIQNFVVSIFNKSNLKICLILIILDTVTCDMEQETKERATFELRTFYILLWTDRDYVPFSYWHTKQNSFTTIGCQYQNCYIVDDILFFRDVTDYDAILFNSIDLTIDTVLPKVRSNSQIYVFVSTESSINYLIHEKFNWFFNYTLTYKLDSDIYYPYFITRNKRGEVIAPSKDIKWMDIDDMEPLSISIEDKLKKKKVAATWFVTNCRPNKRIHYLRDLRGALQKYNLNVDVYGFCEANKVCLKDKMENCLDLIESDYYFYLSFENSDTEDYVTEKLMNALDHYAVPVVMGGADYSRFMPDGIYLNANNLTGAQLAKRMLEDIENKEKYYEYFKWHGHYSYHVATDSADTDPLCRFCAFLNDESTRLRGQVYARFVKWWNGFDSNVNAVGDIIVYYNYSHTLLKTELKVTTEHTKAPQEFIIQSVTPSIAEIVGDFVGNLFGFYSN